MAYTTQRGKMHRGHYRDADGKTRMAGSSKSKREALRLVQDQEAKVHRGEWFSRDSGKMTFTEYFEEHWLPSQTGELATLSTYNSHYESSLRAAFGEVELRKISLALIQRWVIAEGKAGKVRPGRRSKFWPGVLGTGVAVAPSMPSSAP